MHAHRVKIERMDRDACLAQLRELADVLPPQVQGGQLRRMLAAYAERLVEFDPDVLGEALKRIAETCRRWPALADIVAACRQIAREREAYRRAPGRPGGSSLTGDIAEPGVGLAAVAVTLLRRGLSAPAVRRELEGLVDVLGVERAREIATAAWERGGSEAALESVYTAAGTEPPWRRREPPPWRARPLDMDEAIRDVLRCMPPWVRHAMDEPCEDNGGVAWRELASPSAIVRAMAEVWREEVPADADEPSRHWYAWRLGKALQAAMACGGPNHLKDPDIRPKFRPVRGTKIWSHEALEKLLVLLEEKRLPDVLHDFGVSILHRHLLEGRVPARIADRAIALCRAEGRITDSPPPPPAAGIETGMREEGAGV